LDSGTGDIVDAANGLRYTSLEENMAKPNSVRGFDRTDYEIRGEEEFHRAELSVKMRNMEGVQANP